MQRTGPSAGSPMETWAPLPEPVAAALEQTRVRLRIEPQVEAILLGGPLALGLVAPKNDVDLTIIKNADKELAC
jgi:hypothetical protein